MGKLLKLLRVWPKNNRVTYSFHSLSFQPKSRNLLSGWTNEFTQNLNSTTGTVSRHSATSFWWEDPHSPDLQDNRLKYYCYAWAMLSEHGHKTLRIEAQTLYLSMDTTPKNEHYIWEWILHIGIDPGVVLLLMYCIHAYAKCQRNSRATDFQSFSSR